MWAVLQDQWFYGFDDANQMERIVVRLTVALALGAALGYEREGVRKAAGLRTHMLVAVGAALFVLVPVEAGFSRTAIARVVQGLTMGIGFLGGGAILKKTQKGEIHGLTTAATIWVTAAIGMAVGLGFAWPAIYVVVLALFTLLVIGWLESRIEGRHRREHPTIDGSQRNNSGH